MKNFIFLTMLFTIPFLANAEQYVAQASPEVCLDIAHSYDRALDANNNTELFFLDMMISHCGDYFHDNEKQVHYQSLMKTDKRFM